MSKTKAQQDGFKYVDDLDSCEKADIRAEFYRNMGFDVRLVEKKAKDGHIWYSLFIKKEV